MEMMPPIYPDRSNFGSNQWYSVFLDGEGEASIAAKLQIFNTGKEPLNNITLEIPGTSVRILVLLQELPTKQQQCVQWETICGAYSPDSVCTAWGPGGAGDCVKFEKPCMRQEQRCMQYQEVIGYPYTYVPIEAPKETLSKSTKITIPLAQAIAAQEQGTLLVYYKAANVAEKSFGVWSFGFETLKWSFDTNQVRVSVNVEPGFFLKGQKAEVEYQPAMFGAFATAEKMSIASPSQELSDASNRIMYEPGWVRETRGIDPWESFHVIGEYAKSRFLLQKGSIFVSLLVVAALLCGSIFGVRKLMRVKMSAGMPVQVIVAGFVSSFVLIVSWWFVVYIMKNVSRWMNYSHSELVLPIMVLVSIVWFLVWVFGPAIFVGIKTESVFAGILTLVSTILWLIVLLVGLIIVLGAVGSPPVVYEALLGGR
jgi:hypothetical protein